MKYFLPILLGFSLVGANAQTSYDVTNRVVLENEDCQLTKTSLILPVPQSNNYQTITNLEYSSGQVLDAVNSENKYLRDVKVSDLPGIGESYSLTEHFDVTLYPMHIDMSQFETLYPYDTESDIYKRYTVSKGEYIDIENQTIQQVSDRIWSQSNENVLTYAELCYEYVAENYEYLNPNTGIHPIAEILSDGGGDCGNLASIYVNLLRAKKIPAKHIVTVRPDGTYHVWADFYLENYGWIPVDVNMKLDYPEGNFFGYCRGDGIVMSEDICSEVEFYSGEPYNAVLLQNYLFWYWCSSGNRVETSHRVSSTLVSEPPACSVSEVGAEQATILFPDNSGADAYRVRVFDTASLLVAESKVEASEKSFTVESLSPGTEYWVEATPLRYVDNIEAQMTTSSISFTTAEAPTAIETVSDGAPVITATSGKLSVRTSSDSQLSLFTLAGQCIYREKLASGLVQLTVPEAILILKITDKDGEVLTQKVNCN